MLSHKSMQRDREKVLLPCIFLKLVSPQQKQLSAESLGLSLNLFSLEKKGSQLIPNTCTAGGWVSSCSGQSAHSFCEDPSWHDLRGGLRSMLSHVGWNHKRELSGPSLIVSGRIRQLASVLYLGYKCSQPQMEWKMKWLSSFYSLQQEVMITLQFDNRRPEGLLHMDCSVWKQT